MAQLTQAEIHQNASAEYADVGTRVEVTPEMIEAGLEVYRHTPFADVEPIRQLLIEVYEQMTLARFRALARKITAKGMPDDGC